MHHSRACFKMACFYCNEEQRKRDVMGQELNKEYEIRILLQTQDTHWEYKFK